MYSINPGPNLRNLSKGQDKQNKRKDAARTRQSRSLIKYKHRELWLAFLLCVTIIFVQGQTSASSVESSAEGYLGETAATDDRGGSINAERYDEGRVWLDGKPIPDEIILSLTHLRQRDERWNEISLGGSNDGDEGCALTSRHVWFPTMPDMTLLLLEEMAKRHPVSGRPPPNMICGCIKDDTIDEPIKLNSTDYVQDTIVRHLS